MYNLASSRGLNAAVLVTEATTRFGGAYLGNAVNRLCTPERCALFRLGWKYSSKAVVSDHPEDIGDVVKEVELTRNNGNGLQQSSTMKVLLIEKSLALRSLMSNECPVVHDAHAGAVVDVRADSSAVKDNPDVQQKDVEIQLQVDQLLREAKTSIRRASNIQPYEDVEYVEDSKEPKKVKMELVGALKPNALDWKSTRIDTSKLGSYYASLSKSRLTGLVVLTAMAGYAMAPCPMDPLTFVLCSVGTGLTSSAANAVNQFFEVPYDSQMDRTKNRILVRGLITPLHALSFAACCGAAGVGILYCGVNGFAASLGVLNLVLYTSVYTPMKRMSIVNTWLGSVVGAIPPLIGWVGCSGQLEVGAWIMAAILYSWQFPHFNALSWNLRADYSRAGYRMMSVTNPGMCRRVALRHSVGMIAICSLAPVLDVTTWTFAVDSLPFNSYLAFLAWRFHRDGDSNSSRKLFMFSLIHLPAILMLMIISKKHYSKDNEKKKAEDVSTESVNIAKLGGDSSIGTVR